MVQARDYECEVLVCATDGWQRSVWKEDYWSTVDEAESE